MTTNKFMPKKPELNFFIYGMRGKAALWDAKEVEEHINNWFAKEIAPLFENAVEVAYSGSERLVDDYYKRTREKWVTQPWDQGNPPMHIALLIKPQPQPLKEETADDLLREIFDAQGKAEYVAVGRHHLNRIKTYLEKKGIK